MSLLQASLEDIRTRQPFLERGDLASGARLTEQLRPATFYLHRAALALARRGHGGGARLLQSLESLSALCELALQAPAALPAAAIGSISGSVAEIKGSSASARWLSGVKLPFKAIGAVALLGTRNALTLTARRLAGMLLMNHLKTALTAPEAGAASRAFFDARYCLKLHSDEDYARLFRSRAYFASLLPLVLQEIEVMTVDQLAHWSYATTPQPLAVAEIQLEQGDGRAAFDGLLVAFIQNTVTHHGLRAMPALERVSGHLYACLNNKTPWLLFGLDENVLHLEYNHDLLSLRKQMDARYLALRYLLHHLYRAAATPELLAIQKMAFSYYKAYYEKACDKDESLLADSLRAQQTLKHQPTSPFRLTPLAL